MPEIWLTLGLLLLAPLLFIIKNSTSPHPKFTPIPDPRPAPDAL